MLSKYKRKYLTFEDTFSFFRVRTNLIKRCSCIIKNVFKYGAKDLLSNFEIIFDEMPFFRYFKIGVFDCLQD